MDEYKDGLREFLQYINSGAHAAEAAAEYEKYLRENARWKGGDIVRALEARMAFFREKFAEFEKAAKATTEAAASTMIFDAAHRSYLAYTQLKGLKYDAALFRQQYDAIAPITRSFVDADLKSYNPCFHLLSSAYSVKLQKFRLESIFAQRIVDMHNKLYLALEYWAR